MALAMGAENNVFERNGEVSIGVTYMTGSLVGSGSASWRRWSAPIASTDSLPGSLDEFRSRGCRRGCVLPASRADSLMGRVAALLAPVAWRATPAP